MSGVKKEYVNYKNGWPKSWSEILSEKLNMTLINKAKGGLGNDAIFDEFCIQSDKIEKNDIVIIGWSYLNRFRFPKFIEDWKWENMSVYSEPPPLSKRTIEQVGVSRDNILYEDELHNRETLIKSYAKLKGFKVYFWNAALPLKNENGYLLQNIERESNEDTFIQIVSRLGGQKIIDETNGIVNDNHLGEVGHIIQANLFYDEIKLTL